MRHISKFNKEITEIIDADPEEKGYKLIKHYRFKQGIKDYYKTLRDLGIKVGFEFDIAYDEDEKERPLFTPYFRYSSTNWFGKPSGIKSLSYLTKDSKGYKSEIQCYGFTARQYMFAFQKHLSDISTERLEILKSELYI